MSELANTEYARGRSWFVTLTFAPHIRALITMEARRAAGEKEWTEMSREHRGNSLARQAQSYVTRYIKRVREESGAALRYLSVTELHKDGFPHVHLLVHEAGEDQKLRHRILTRQWAERPGGSERGPTIALGFTNAKLVESGEDAARYIAKYLAKNPVTRVRASVGYGHDPGQQRPQA